MHRPIGAVFKVIIISIILMVTMDTIFIVTDTITVRNRVTTLATVMQDELSRNNSIPDDISVLFDNQLNEIVENSNIATGIEWNLNSSKTVDGVTYDPISETYVKNYGELLGLVISVRMQPRSLVFSRGVTDGSFIVDGGLLDYTDDYVYRVPALRYLK